MASLKEIKGRINSINGTLKITSAMKMVASSKLRKAQEAIENMYPYESKLHQFLEDLMYSGASVNPIYTDARPLKRVAIVVFASNSSLCGGYNMNIIRSLEGILSAYEASLGKENILVYPVGKKVAEAVRKRGYTPMGDFQHMSGKPNYQEAANLAVELTHKFTRNEVQKVELIYNHFKSTSTQVLTHENYLPLELPVQAEGQSVTHHDEFILEPSSDVLVTSLLPKVIKMKIFTVLLDAVAAEHAARTMAMQIATDNANDLIQDLTLMYNKSRQQAITNELLDIVGGTMS